MAASLDGVGMEAPEIGNRVGGDGFATLEGQPTKPVIIIDDGNGGIPAFIGDKTSLVEGCSGVGHGFPLQDGFR